MAIDPKQLEHARAVEQRLTGAGERFELVDVEVAGRRCKAYRNAAATLPEVIESGRRHGDREFMLYEGDHWSFNRFYAAVDALAGRLQADLGVGAGARVAIAMRNRPEWAVAFAAVAMTGAVPVPINSFGMHDELAAALTDVRPCVLICDSDRRRRIGDELATWGIGDIVVDAADVGGVATRDFASMIAPGGPQVRTPVLAPDDPALILFTSGTSSRAKPVVSSQRAVCQALFNIEFIGTFSAMTSPHEVETLMARGIEPATLTAVPLFHVSGLHAQLLASLVGGRRLVFLHRWDVTRALALIRSERITQFNGAPTMVQQLLAAPGFDTCRDTLGGLGFGGAGLPQRIIDGVRERLPGSFSGIGFGMTESNGVGAAACGQLFFGRPTSSGLLSPVMELRVNGLDGEALPQGQTGELCLRGVCVMDGYWNDPGANARALEADGWLHTGDVGYLDEDGFVHVVDRIKDVINFNGEKIASAEIESCLLQNPQVQSAAVFGAPDDATGEAVVAVVVAREGAVLSADALKAHVAARLAPHKVPRDVHVRTTELPCSPTGKLLKNKLKNEYA